MVQVTRFGRFCRLHYKRLKKKKKQHKQISANLVRFRYPGCFSNLANFFRASYLDYYNSYKKCFYVFFFANCSYFFGSKNILNRLHVKMISILILMKYFFFHPYWVGFGIIKLWLTMPIINLNMCMFGSIPTSQCLIFVTL